MATGVIFTRSSSLLFFVTGVLVHLNKQASAQTTLNWSADELAFDNTPFSQTAVQTVPGTLNPPKPSQKYKRTGLVISSNGTLFWRGIADAYYLLCRRSCRRRTISYSHCPECFCDDVCFFFADCCPDVYADAGHGPVAHSKWSGLTCSQTSFGAAIPSWEGVLMVTTCLDNATDRTVVNNCLNSTIANRGFTRPVTETGTFLTYKNVFCAQCNGAHDTTPWRIMSSSDSISTTSEVTSQSTVETEVTASQVDAVSYGRPLAYAKHQRSCRSDIVMVTRCNKREFYGYFEPALDRVCTSLVIPVRVSSVWYQNPFCVLCNSNLTWNELWRNFRYFSDLVFADIPMLTLVAISPQCTEQEFYDWQKDSCLPVACVPEKFLTSSFHVSCKSDIESSHLFGYRFCVYAKIRSLDNQGFLMNSTDSEELSDSLRLMFEQILELSYARFQVTRVMKAPLGDKRTETYLWAIDTLPHSSVDRDEVDAKLLERFPIVVQELAALFHVPNLRASPTCSASVLLSLVKNSFDEAAPGETNNYSHRSDDDVVASLQSTLHADPYLPVMQPLVCPWLRLDLADVAYDLERNEAILRRSTVVLSPPDFYIPNFNIILVCLEDYQRSLETFTPPYIVSLVSTIISQVFLLLSFLVYSFFPSLRTIAGINNMILIVSLFFAQIFLQIGHGVAMPYWLCQTVGLATHFSWLCVMLSQNACTFHLFYSLSFPFRSHATCVDARGMTKRYLLYVLVVAIVFNLITLTWQLALEGDSGYGSENCYIKRMYVRVAMFAAPLALTVLANVVMFLYTVVQLQRLPRLAGSQTDKISLLLYTKLSVLTGITWLLGFLTSLVGSIVFGYAFAVIQGFQGLFVFLAFIANKNVFTMVAGKLKKKKNSRVKRERKDSIESTYVTCLN